MARLAATMLCALSACTDNPYWIGELRAPEPGCAPDALVCSGFERALADEWPTTRFENAGELERSSERVHSGTGALRAGSRGARSVAVVIARFAPLHTGTLYLRAHLYVAD